MKQSEKKSDVLSDVFLDLFLPKNRAEYFKMFWPWLLSIKPYFWNNNLGIKWQNKIDLW